MTRKPRPTPQAAQKRAQIAGPLTLYLLHAPVPVRRARHYLGITRSDRLAARLREHAHRRGSSLTAAMAARNEHLVLVRTWEGVDWEYERRMKQRGRYDRQCPICNRDEPQSEFPIVPCPDLADLDTLKRNLGLGFPLRPPHSQ